MNKSAKGSHRGRGRHASVAACLCLSAMVIHACAGQPGDTPAAEVETTGLPGDVPEAGQPLPPTPKVEPLEAIGAVVPCGHLESSGVDPPPAEDITYVCADGDLLLVAGASGILTLFELEEPAAPTCLSHILLSEEAIEETGFVQGQPSPEVDIEPAEVRETIVHEGRLFVMTRSRLLAFDLTDPRAPVPLGGLSLPARLNDMQLRGDEVTVAIADTLDNRLLVIVIDASDPAAMDPVSLGVFPGASAARTRLAGDLAYVTDRQLTTAPELALYSIADPGSPAAVGTVPGIPAFRAWVRENLAFVATANFVDDGDVGPHPEEASLVIVDLSDPTQPRVTGAIETADLAIDLVVLNDRVYWVMIDRSGDVDAWLTVADIHDPEQPVVLSRLAFSGSLGVQEVVSQANGHLYIAAGHAGVHIVSLDTEQIIATLSRAAFFAP